MQERLSARATEHLRGSTASALRAQLVQNVVLRHLDQSERDELMASVAVVECAKGEILLKAMVDDMVEQATAFMTGKNDSLRSLQR